MGLLRAGSSDGWRNRLYRLCSYKASFLSCVSSKAVKLDKLPVHVYEVDEEADKDEVVFLLPLVSLLTLHSDGAGFERSADLQAQAGIGMLNEAKEEVFKNVLLGLT